MPRSNAELIQTRFEAWLRGERPWKFDPDEVDPGIVFRPQPDWPEPGPYVGIDEVAEVFEGLRGAWNQVDFEWEPPVAAGDKVLVRIRHPSTGRARGVPILNEYTAIYTFRGGRIAMIEFFAGREEALRAVGLTARAAPGEGSAGLSPLVMGVVNVTPDSFSDGGEFLDPVAAVAHGRQLAEEGADILDVGGESTRPGAEPVPVAEELRRVAPVVSELASWPEAPRISIDTTKVEVARDALDAGATIVNDVSAFRFAPELAGLVADRAADCCLMHMLGEPGTMQEDPRYDDVVAAVKAFLEERLAFAVSEGVPEGHVWLDPGIGFGKTVEHNLELLRRLGEIAAIGRPVVVGTSRKSFLGRLTGRSERERVPGTLATNVLALERGADIFRVHDVAAARDALDVAAATLSGGWKPANP